MHRSLVFGLIAGSLGAGFIAAAAGAENVTIPAAAGLPQISGYLARPSSPGPAPAVLVLPGCEGLTPMNTATADDLAGHGFVGLTIDVNGALGVRNACTDARTLAPLGARYAAASLGWLANQSYTKPNQLGIVGYSMGAIEVLDLIDPWTPAPPPAGLRVAVAYYPNCEGRPASITVPLQILDGAADDWTPSQPCQTLAQTAAAAGKPVQITTYPGVTHAFNQPSNSTRHYLGHTLIYDPKASADADVKTMAFFAQYLH